MKKNAMARKNQSQKNKEKSDLILSQQNFRIYLRVKPNFNQQPHKQILKITGTNRIEIHSPYYSSGEAVKTYNYEQVFNQQTNNEKVFYRTMVDPIKNALQGFNSTVFIYGMTGAGKTYTMFGNIGSVTTKGPKTDEQGLVTMTVDHLFSEIVKQENIATQVFVSFYEIYNQNIRDLLQDGPASHQIMEDPVRGFFIQDLTELNAEDKNHTKDIIMSGIQRRAMNSTKSNQVSSRSHAILQFTIKRYITQSNDENKVLQSKFFMIDLAGNQKTANNESKRFIEGVNINKSLLTLGKCLNILAQGKGSYVPFRDSKLTRILKQSLGGNSKTAMIACVASDKKYYEETLNTLKYSTIARKIKNKGLRHNVKIITKHQMPQNKNCVAVPHTGHPNIKYESQEKIKSQISDLIIAIQEKSKIERLQEQLEQSRQQNEQMLQRTEGDHKIWTQNVKMIDDTLKRLMRAYEKNMSKAQNAYQNLLTGIFGTIQQRSRQNQHIQNQGNQIHRLHNIINIQKKQILDLSYKASQVSMDQGNLSILHHPQSICKSDAKKIDEINMTHPVQHKENVNYDSSSNYSKTSKRCKGILKKPKNLVINCFDETPRSVLQNLKTSNCSEMTNQEYPRIRNVQQKQITITLNGDKLPSSSRNKQQFIRKLKQTEKKAKVLDGSIISNLLEEQEIHRYQLGNTEESMLRKLKFFQRQKSLQKSNSLSHIPARSASTNKFFMKK